MKMQILTLFNLNRTFSFHIWMVFLFIVLRNFRILVYIHMLYHKNHELVVTRSLCSRLWGQRPTECDISCPADLCLSPLSTLRPLSPQARTIWVTHTPLHTLPRSKYKMYTSKHTHLNSNICDDLNLL